MPRSERALILLKPQFLGDAVMACPLIDSISAAFEKPVVMCGPVITELLECRGDRVAFEPGEKISGFGPVFRTARRLRALRIDTAFLVNRSFRSALAVRLAGIRNRVGHATEGRGFLLTHRVRYDLKRFEADCYLDLARVLHIEPKYSHPKLQAKAEPRLLEGATVGLQPGARYPDKQVPLEVMAKVAQSLIRKGTKIALFGGKDEIEFSRGFQSLVTGNCADFVGKLIIRETMSCLAALRVMAGSDTGLMHVAAALGTPTVTVFGPNPASKWGHHYSPHKVIEAPDGKPALVTAQQILDQIEAIA